MNITIQSLHDPEGLEFATISIDGEVHVVGWNATEDDTDDEFATLVIELDNDHRLKPSEVTPVCEALRSAYLTYLQG